VNHAGSPEGIGVYKVEPYVVAADVYALSPHTGRGGWTWYTGSAGWTDFKVHYRYRETVYHITVQQRRDASGQTSVTIDGVQRHEPAIHLVDDHQEHSVVVTRPFTPAIQESP
jgi:cellobiose phosphorylase